MPSRKFYGCRLLGKWKAVRFVDLRLHGNAVVVDGLGNGRLAWCYQQPGWRDEFQLLHLGKAGGTTVEWLLRMGHSNHHPLVMHQGYTTKR
eukprot:4761448-Amphidinium_carterae.2